VPEQSFFFCERCGAQTALGPRAPNAHYCVACRLFTCDSCWTDSAVRCDSCAARSTAKASGLTAARPLVGALSGVRGELAGVAERQKATGESAEELDSERHLLAVKAGSILAATELALGQVQPPHAASARSLGRRAHAEMASIAEQLRPGEPERHPRRDARLQLRRTWLAVQRPWQAVQAIRGKVTIRSFVLPIAAVTTAVVVIAAVLFLRPGSGPFTAGAPSPSPTHEGQVAGGTPAFPAASPPAPAGGPNAKSVSFTFDELVAYEGPGAGWDLPDGNGLAEIAPFPNAVDRSLLLASASGSGSATICRDGLPDADLVSIDLSAADWRGMSIEVRRGTEAAAISVDDGSHLVLQAGGRTAELTDQFAATGWLRLTASMDLAQGSIEVRAEPRGGGAGASGVVPLPDSWQAAVGQVTTVCITSPSSSPDEVYIDNLIISASGGQEG
jgi:hypothetical protein